MDINTGAAIFSLLDQSLGLLKKSRDVMPDSKEKKELSKKLAEVEAAYHIAEAKAAQELGYELCKCSWPPQIMLISADGQAECSKCKRRTGSATLNQTASDAPEKLGEEETKILGKLSNSGSVTLDELSRPLKISDQRVLYWLTKLLERGMVRKAAVPMVGPMYSLEQQGREYLITNGLL